MALTLMVLGPGSWGQPHQFSVLLVLVDPKSVKSKMIKKKIKEKYDSLCTVYKDL